eukprot:g13062.t1
MTEDQAPEQPPDTAAPCMPEQPPDSELENLRSGSRRISRIGSRRNAIEIDTPKERNTSSEYRFAPQVPLGALRPELDASIVEILDEKENHARHTATSETDGEGAEDMGERDDKNDHKDRDHGEGDMTLSLLCAQMDTLNVSLRSRRFLDRSTLSGKSNTQPRAVAPTPHAASFDHAPEHNGSTFATSPEKADVVLDLVDALAFSSRNSVEKQFAEQAVKAQLVVDPDLSPLSKARSSLGGSQATLEDGEQNEVDALILSVEQHERRITQELTALQRNIAEAEGRVQNATLEADVEDFVQQHAEQEMQLAAGVGTNKVAATTDAVDLDAEADYFKVSGTGEDGREDERKNTSTTGRTDDEVIPGVPRLGPRVSIADALGDNFLNFDALVRSMEGEGLLPNPKPSVVCQRAYGHVQRANPAPQGQEDWCSTATTTHQRPVAVPRLSTSEKSLPSCILVWPPNPADLMRPLNAMSEMHIVLASSPGARKPQLSAPMPPRLSSGKLRSGVFKQLDQNLNLKQFFAVSMLHTASSSSPAGAVGVEPKLLVDSEKESLEVISDALAPPAMVSLHKEPSSARLKEEVVVTNRHSRLCGATVTEVDIGPTRKLERQTVSAVSIERAVRPFDNVVLIAPFAADVVDAGSATSATDEMEIITGPAAGDTRAAPVVVARPAEVEATSPQAATTRLALFGSTETVLMSCLPCVFKSGDALMSSSQEVVPDPDVRSAAKTTSPKRASGTGAHVVARERQQRQSDTGDSASAGNDGKTKKNVTRLYNKARRSPSAAPREDEQKRRSATGTVARSHQSVTSSAMPATIMSSQPPVAVPAAEQYDVSPSPQHFATAVFSASTPLISHPKRAERVGTPFAGESLKARQARGMEAEAESVAATDDNKAAFVTTEVILKSYAAAANKAQEQGTATSGTSDGGSQERRAAKHKLVEVPQFVPGPVQHPVLEPRPLMKEKDPRAKRAAKEASSSNYYLANQEGTHSFQFLNSSVSSDFLEDTERAGEKASNRSMKKPDRRRRLGTGRTSSGDAKRYFADPTAPAPVRIDRRFEGGPERENIADAVKELADSPPSSTITTKGVGLFYPESVSLSSPRSSERSAAASEVEPTLTSIGQEKVGELCPDHDRSRIAVPDEVRRRCIRFQR